MLTVSQYSLRRLSLNKPCRVSRTFLAQGAIAVPGSSQHAHWDTYCRLEERSFAVPKTVPKKKDTTHSDGPEANIMRPLLLPTSTSELHARGPWQSLNIYVCDHSGRKQLGQSARILRRKKKTSLRITCFFLAARSAPCDYRAIPSRNMGPDSRSCSRVKHRKGSLRLDGSLAIILCFARSKLRGPRSHIGVSWWAQPSEASCHLGARVSIYPRAPNTLLIPKAPVRFFNFLLYFQEQNIFYPRIMYSWYLSAL